MATGDLEYYLANNPFYMAGVSSARNNANLDYSRMSPLEAALAGFVSGAGTGALTSYGRSQAQEDYNNDYNSYREAMNSYLTTGDTSLIDALQGTNPFSQKAQDMREKIELKNLENSLAPKDKSKVMVSGAILNQYIGADVYDSNEEYPVSAKELKNMMDTINGVSSKGSGDNYLEMTRQLNYEKKLEEREKENIKFNKEEATDRYGEDFVNKVFRNEDDSFTKKDLDERYAIYSKEEDRKIKQEKNMYANKQAIRQETKEFNDNLKKMQAVRNKAANIYNALVSATRDPSLNVVKVTNALKSLDEITLGENTATRDYFANMNTSGSAISEGIKSVINIFDRNQFSKKDMHYIQEYANMAKQLVNAYDDAVTEDLFIWGERYSNGDFDIMPETKHRIETTIKQWTHRNPAIKEKLNRKMERLVRK